jgi:rod shape-determining protein MreC
MRFNSLKKKVLIFCLTILSLFFVYQFQSQIKNTAYFIFSPFQKIFLKFDQKIFSFFETIFRISNLKKENEVLKREIKKLIVENENLKELKNENQQLKKALEMGPEKEFDIKIARFVGKDVSEDIFLIDKGKKDELKEGNVVILPEKVLIGKIIKVYDNFSKVKVFTFKDFSFDVKIPEKEIKALAKGEGNFKARVELIPKENEISVGDKVFTTILGGHFPEGILVGEIEKIEDSDILAYKKAELKPAFEFGELDWLFVISNFQ